MDYVNPRLYNGVYWEGCFTADGKPDETGKYHSDGPFVLKSDYDKLLNEYIKALKNPIIVFEQGHRAD